jgi:transglutaminase-like putative cysteine protease
VTDAPATPSAPAAGAARRRDVGTTLGFELHQPSLLALQVAVSRTGLIDEELVVTGAGGAPVPVREVVGSLGGRVHLVDAPVGPLLASYRASTAPPAGPVGEAPDPEGEEVLSGLRQSRYCPSDLLTSFARAELDPLGDLDDPAAVAAAAASWTFERLAYVPGSSGPGDSALDTLLARQGICRDYAHVTIALCRALSVPARLAAVYAPGLSPMDFHAVAEVWVGDRWVLHDATRLAPRSSLVRVATGRDAADTALTATIRGDVELVTSEVFAVIDGDLPGDDHVTPCSLA